MSFWADLQAWTQAQYDALVLANLKRKRKWTADEINRLLRDRIAKRLKAKQGRSIGAEFLRTAGRLVPVVPPTPLGVIDHGWLAYTSPTLPASIYADTTLAGYLAGTGTAIPGGSETDHLIGSMAADAGRSCASGYNGIDWTAPPTLDGAGKYDSFSWASAAPANTYAIPHRHSGLGVAFAQALLGTGRKFADVLPAGWSYDPTTISLVRGPDRAYWLTKTDSAGCFLTRLSLPAAYYCLDYWLANDLLSGYSAALAEAIVLGNLTLPADPTIYESLSAAGIAGVYANSAIDMPSWGWQWTTQRLGESDELAPKAILVTIYAINPTSYLNLRNISRTCRLTLNWDGSNLPTTATLSISESGQWRLNEFYLKVFRLNAAEDTLSRWDPQGGITFVTLNVEGPFAAWYGADAEEVIAKWSGVDDYAGLTESWTNPAPFVCGLGTVTRSTYRIWDDCKKVSLEVGASKVELTTAPFSGAYSSGVYSYTAGDSGNTNTGNPGNLPVTGCDGGLVYCPNNEDGDYWIENSLSDGPGANTYAKHAAQSPANVAGSLVIAFGPPRTIWARQILVNGSGASWANTYQYPLAVGGWHASHPKGCEVDTRSSYEYLFFWANDTARTESGTLAEGEVLDSEAVAFLGEDSVALDAELAWWSTLWGLGGTGTTSQVPLALVSRGGLAAYMDAPGASPLWEMPAGISISSPAGTVKGWVGGV